MSVLLKVTEKGIISMDKLKIVVDYSKKYGFWILLGLTVLVVLGCWWMATASVASDVKAKRTKIEETITKVQTISNTADHPNPTYLKSLEEEQNKLKERVLVAWKALYEQQQEKNPWPDVLGKEFLDMIKDLKPNEEIPYTYRGRYLNFIKEYFPTLLNEVNYRHPKEGADPAAVGPNGEKQVDMEGIVDWDAGDIKRLQDKFEWRETPSDIKVKLAQEDLWVMLSLLRVIRNTNDKITEHSKAAIKHIDALEIGANAVAAWKAAEGQVFHGGETSGGANSVPTAGAPGGPLGAATGAPATSGEAASAEKDVLLFNRYVDDKGNPLTGDAKSPYSEFKMMPIRMQLYIDQRKIAKLLVECANSAMPIEVRRVRINPGKGQVVDFGTGGTGASTGAPGGAPGGFGPPAGAPGYGPPGAPPGYGPPGGMPGYGPPMRGGPPGYGPQVGRGGGFGGPAGGGIPMPGGGGGVGAVAWEKGAMDISVEIQGIICIYNPPDKDKLGTGAANDATPAAPAAAPAAPGATPAAPTPETPGTGPAPATTPAATPETTPGGTPAGTPAAAPAGAPATVPAGTPAAPPAVPPGETPPAAPLEPAKGG
jgi:hypothetical protein